MSIAMPAGIEQVAKLRLDVARGRALAERLDREVDFMPIVRTAVLDCGIGSPARALHALGGFLQWFSVAPIAEDRGEAYVMLRGEVDRIWHAAILHTAFYREICGRYIGRFVDHESSFGAPRTAWVLETVALIEAEFGVSMHPEFAAWRAGALVESDDGPRADVHHGIRRGSRARVLRPHVANGSPAPHSS